MIKKELKQQIIKEYAVHEGDTGSPEVQIAILTQRINELTAHLKLKPFPVSLLKTILKDYSPRCTNADLLDLWTITGGVARYVAMLMDAGAVKRKKMLSFIFSPLSPFVEEGRSILVQEFGSEYTNYFSVLAAIAS